jgi:uncharacterized membrane protein
MEPTDDKKGCEIKHCGCLCHRMTGVFYVLIGIALLLEAFDVLKADLVWMVLGILVVLWGLQSIFSGYCKCCGRPGSD